MQTINPTTDEPIETYDEHDDEALERFVQRSADRFESWSERPITERQALVGGIADVLCENEDDYAALMTREMGKPIEQARAEIEKCSWVCEFYAEHAAQFLQDERIGVHPRAKTKVSYEPLGPLLAVMPWNYPFWQVLRVAAPTLAAGNTVLLSHARNVTGCATTIERVLADAGFPDGAFTTILVDDDSLHDVIADDRVAAATLTGSVRAGRAVAETTGANLKPTVLELGGSDPFVVLDDAPLERACEVGAQARVNNNGQACIAAKRFIVVEDVYEEFRDGFVREMESLTVGDPTDPDTDVGPIARADLLDTLETQVTESLDAGATALTGGERINREGYFFEPTVLEDVPADSPAGCDELFGPVASLFVVEDEDEAIALANDTEFGLGASVWTTDLERGERVAHELEAGAAFVNELVQSHPKLPFGGIKNSGYGRELAADGIREFTNKKTVWVSPADGLDE
ncbi:NAD-dependent succinate-semialdehyde dehydrogenase [Halostagnicola kamekurae]|uniref:Succinate semialdehyde dehydrogenase n=1 Tax=Halostagnicola kamekurae TaxID=619731 RepID=A0A1I6V1C5_9EURY|nr:NAD-dependent succinate-semialdehyde dehydrogenase [Halostagnicola kamekurae]SFT07478.1 succinate semialdehyde dehydrogenase [Halostagnicola kamekurae]